MRWTHEIQCDGDRGLSRNSLTRAELRVVCLIAKGLSRTRNNRVHVNRRQPCEAHADGLAQTCRSTQEACPERVVRLADGEPPDAVQCVRDSGWVSQFLPASQCIAQVLS